MKAATKKIRYFLTVRHISIHAAREGGDRPKCKLSQRVFLFQSTPPVKAATLADRMKAMLEAISIHAAREGGDFVFGYRVLNSCNFNPRRP